MNGVALVLALVLTGPDDPDFSVGKTENDRVEYTIQIPPAIAKLVGDGEEVHSPVPAETGPVDRLCIRIGKNPAPHTGAGVQTFRKLIADAARDTSLSRGGQAAIVWPASGLPRTTQGITFGWQPDQEGKLAYYVQIEPAVLKSLKEGDELYCTIDPVASQMATIVVLSGNRQLPKVPASGGALSPLASNPPSPTGTSSSPLGGQTPLGQAPLGPAPPTTPVAQGTRPGSALESRTLGNALEPAARTGADLGQGGGFGRPPAAAPQAAPNLYDDAPPLTSPNGTAPSALAPQYAPLEDQRFADQRFSTPPPAAPQYNDARGYNQNVAANGYGQNGYNQYGGSQTPPGQFDNRAGQNLAPAGNNGYGGYGIPGDASRTVLQPPDRGVPKYAPPPAADPPRSQFGDPAPASDTRVASLPPQAVSPTATSTILPPAETAAAAKDQWWWPYWLLLMFSLFLSIGVNLYLGWTTAEYYNRYRTAVDRLRSASRGA